MATPQDQHCPSAPRSTRRSRHRALRSIPLACVLAATLLASPALAAPGDGGSSDPRSAHAEAEAKVARIEQQLAEAEETLQRMTVEAEAAGDAARAAEAALATAQEQADAAAAELEEARAAVGETQQDVAALGREAYMGEDRFGDVVALLDSSSPDELLQRATTLEMLGAERVYNHTRQIQATYDH